MKNKIFKSIFLTVTVSLTLFFAVIFGYMYNHYSDRAREDLEKKGEYVSAGVEEYGVDFLQTLDSGTRVTYIANNGSVIYDSMRDASELENHLEREEIREALLTGEGYSTRFSETFSESTMYYAVRLSDGTVIRVSTSDWTAITMLTEVLGPVLLVYIAVMLLAFLIASRMSQSIVKPINDIDPEHPELLDAYDELRPIIAKLSSQNVKISRQMSLLRQREREFNSITLNMSEGMVVINSRAEVLSCNRSAREVFDVKGPTPKPVLALNSSPSFREAIRAALAGSTGYDSMRKGERFYSILATPVLHDKAVDGAVIVILDVTEKEAREALRREFTSNVSHELKTPLTSISGFAEIIKSGMADADDVRHFAENIHKESSRLISLVGDIIRLSQLDGGEIPYDDEAVDLYLVAEDVCERLQSIAEKKNVSLTLTGEAVSVSGNSLIIEEMLYNLCDNGIKYNRDGGYVKINVRREGGIPVFSVSDNGIGIPQDKQERVFERFYRVDKSHSRSIGGTGLGLSIVKHAAAYHKAEITLESEEGVGTTVSVRFSHNTQ